MSSSVGLTKIQFACSFDTIAMGVSAIFSKNRQSHWSLLVPSLFCLKHLELQWCDMDQMFNKMTLIWMSFVIPKSYRAGKLEARSAKPSRPSPACARYVFWATSLATKETLLKLLPKDSFPELLEVIDPFIGVPWAVSSNEAGPKGRFCYWIFAMLGSAPPN